MSNILTDVEAFVAASGLSEHRAGILLAQNGRLVERLREGGRIWPDTEQRIRENIASETARRALSFEVAK